VDSEKIEQLVDNKYDYIVKKGRRRVNNSKPRRPMPDEPKLIFSRPMGQKCP
jgi:hypothetical protein